MYSKHFVYILYNLGAFYIVGRTNVKLTAANSLFGQKDDISIDPGNSNLIGTYATADILKGREEGEGGGQEFLPPPPSSPRHTPF